MADAGIKKVIVPQQDIPAVGYEKEKHHIRFRIISEDRTRFTHWSPFFRITNDGVDTSPGYIEPTNPVVPDPEQPDILVADFVDLVWTPRRGRRQKYDIFVRWVNDIDTFGDDYISYPFELLAAQYTGTSMKVKVENTVEDEQSYYVRFIVQLASNPRRNPVLSNRPIYDSGNISLIIDQTS